MVTCKAKKETITYTSVIGRLFNAFVEASRQLNKNDSIKASCFKKDQTIAAIPRCAKLLSYQRNLQVIIL